MASLLSIAIHGHARFLSFMQEHGRNYAEDSHEFSQRRELFERRFQEVEQHNSRADKSWTLGINEFSDWNDDELQTLYGYAGHRDRQQIDVVSPHLSLRQVKKTLPDEKKWKMSALKDIANQGACGSCWAVAAAKMLDANYEKFHGTRRTFSAQQLVSCVPNPDECGGTGKCQGATVELAMAYVSSVGLETTETVPYQGVNGQCADAHTWNIKDGSVSVLQGSGSTNGWLNFTQLAQTTVRQTTAAAQTFKFQQWQRLPINSDEGLATALVEDGVVAVSVAASGWMGYRSGVFSGCPINATINHAVVAVGFGNLDGKKYWEIQNSWGGGWGDEGHIKLLRHESDTEDDKLCGWDNTPNDGTGCAGPPVSDLNPARVRVCGMCGILYDNVIARFAHD